MYNKTIIIRFSFCDIQNNQGLGKGYRLQLITLISTLIILDTVAPRYNKTRYDEDPVITNNI